MYENFRKFSPDHFYDEKFQFYDKKTDFRPETGISSETTETWESRVWLEAGGWKLGGARRNGFRVSVVSLEIPRFPA